MNEEHEEHFDAQLTWVGDMQFVGRGAQDGPTIVFDADPTVGGGNCGMRPVATLLNALASCTAMDVISILRKKHQRVTGFHVNVYATRAEEHPKRLIKAELEYVVRGYDVAPEAVARSIELSLTKYCAVSSSLSAEITRRYRIESETA